jgi:putative FmdB family regulatory protein
MPTYEYKREDGSVFDFLQGINDAPLEVCPTTGLKVKRIISGGSGVIYKGDGWYVTDYKNKNGSEQTNGSAKKTGGDSGGDSSGQAGDDSGSSKTPDGAKPGDNAGKTESGPGTGSESRSGSDS